MVQIETWSSVPCRDEVSLPGGFSSLSFSISHWKINPGKISVRQTASLLYPGSTCWKVWMLHTSLSKQIVPVGKVWGNAGKHSNLWKRVVKGDLYYAVTAPPLWSITIVSAPLLFFILWTLFWSFNILSLAQMNVVQFSRGDVASHARFMFARCRVWRYPSVRLFCNLNRVRCSTGWKHHWAKKRFLGRIKNIDNIFFCTVFWLGLNKKTTQKTSLFRSNIFIYIWIAVLLTKVPRYFYFINTLGILNLALF